MVFVKDVEVNEAATRKLLDKVANIHSTFWGEFFVVSADEDDQQVGQKRLNFKRIAKSRNASSKRRHSV